MMLVIFQLFQPFYFFLLFYRLLAASFRRLIYHLTRFFLSNKISCLYSLRLLRLFYLNRGFFLFGIICDSKSLVTRNNVGFQVVIFTTSKELRNRLYIVLEVCFFLHGGKVNVLLGCESFLLEIFSLGLLNSFILIFNAFCL